MLLWFAEMGQRQERVGDKDSCGEGKEERSDGSRDLLLQMNGQCCTWTPFYGRGDALGKSEKSCDMT